MTSKFASHSTSAAWNFWAPRQTSLFTTPAGVSNPWPQSVRTKTASSPSSRGSSLTGSLVEACWPASGCRMGETEGAGGPKAGGCRVESGVVWTENLQEKPRLLGAGQRGLQMESFGNLQLVPGSWCSWGGWSAATLL
jgi:hypothetical protein